MGADDPFHGDFSGCPIQFDIRHRRRVGVGALRERDASSLHDIAGVLRSAGGSRLPRRFLRCRFQALAAAFIAA